MPFFVRAAAGVNCCRNPTFFNGRTRRRPARDPEMFIFSDKFSIIRTCALAHTNFEGRLAATRKLRLAGGESALAAGGRERAGAG